MPFYKYDQNNSGGSFDNELGYKAFVEADTAHQANSRAESIGIYFDGCDEGLDCSCCGDRWYRASHKPDFGTLSELCANIERTFEYAQMWGLGFTILLADGRQLKIDHLSDLPDREADSRPAQTVSPA